MNEILRFLLLLLLMEIFFASHFSFLTFSLLFFFLLYETLKATKRLRKVLELFFIAFIFFTLAKNYSSFQFHLLAFIFALIFSFFLSSLKTKTTSYHLPLLYFLYLFFYQTNFPLFFKILFLYLSSAFILGKIFSLEKNQKFIFAFLTCQILLSFSFLSLPEEIKALITFLLSFSIFSFFLQEEKSHSNVLKNLRTIKN